MASDLHDSEEHADSAVAGEGSADAAAEPDAESGTGAPTPAADPAGAGSTDARAADSDPVLEVLAALEVERDGYLAALQQSQADFENYKKRAQRLAAEELDRSVGQLVERLLPVLDNVELGVAHGVEGLAPIGRALLDELQKAGLELIDAIDRMFDPHEHEAVGQTPPTATGEPGTVGEVLRSGYRWRGKVLRPAMVLVRSESPD
jgi:molecular chaperone GrpE